MLFLDILAAVTTLLCVLAARSKKVITWPLGILGAGIYCYLFYTTKIYADSVLQLVYVVMGIMGWVSWSNIKGDEIGVKSVFLHEIFRDIILTFILWVGISLILTEYTDASNPYLDAALTSLSLLANYYLIKRYVESWFIWMVVDLGMIVLMFRSELYISMGLYGVLFVICVISLFEWKKESRYGLI